MVHLTGMRCVPLGDYGVSREIWNYASILTDKQGVMVKMMLVREQSVRRSCPGVVQAVDGRRQAVKEAGVCGSVIVACNSERSEIWGVRRDSSNRRRSKCNPIVRHACTISTPLARTSHSPMDNSRILSSHHRLPLLLDHPFDTNTVPSGVVWLTVSKAFLIGRDSERRYPKSVQEIDIGTPRQETKRDMRPTENDPTNDTMSTVELHTHTQRHTGLVGQKSRLTAVHGADDE
ncbi:hypothetical protein BKA66DRAFT_436085 [Pyrenochaeta sp. MPI-SDFR-AT-0127]|nr:hypothetical protein BKA66DRAFT_436085 [Pyrenochaeta sp. MPI-SDFR-AT-0127]